MASDMDRHAHERVHNSCMMQAFEFANPATQDAMTNGRRGDAGRRQVRCISLLTELILQTLGVARVSDRAVRRDGHHGAVVVRGTLVDSLMLQPACVVSLQRQLMTISSD